MRHLLRAVQIAVLVLAGCTTDPNAPFQSSVTRVRMGSYGMGYEDGCNSRLSIGSVVYGGAFRRDPFLYAHDALYAEGWNEGLQSCGH